MRSLCSFVALTALMLAAAGVVRADEEKVPLDKVPKAIMDAVKAKYPDAKIKGAEKETENGKTRFEIAIKDNDQNIDVFLTPEGEIVQLEKEIPSKDLPKVVADALESKYPKATLKKTEQIIEVKDKKETLTNYEVIIVTAENKKLEVVISLEGKITKEEG